MHTGLERHGMSFCCLQARVVIYDDMYTAAQKFGNKKMFFKEMYSTHQVSI